MENESLADVAPAAGGRSVVEEKQQQQQEDDAAWGVHGVNDEHHHQTAQDAQQAGVPGEELEGRSVKNTQRQRTEAAGHMKTEAETINIMLLSHKVYKGYIAILYILLRTSAEMFGFWAECESMRMFLKPSYWPVGGDSKSLKYVPLRQYSNCDI